MYICFLRTAPSKFMNERLWGKKEVICVSWLFTRWNLSPTLYFKDDADTRHYWVVQEGISLWHLSVFTHICKHNCWGHGAGKRTVMLDFTWKTPSQPEWTRAHGDGPTIQWDLKMNLPSKSLTQIDELNVAHNVLKLDASFSLSSKYLLSIYEITAFPRASHWEQVRNL